MIEHRERPTGNGGEGTYPQYMRCPACGADVREKNYSTFWAHVLHKHEPGDFGKSLAELGYPDTDVLERDTRIEWRSNA